MMHQHLHQREKASKKKKPTVVIGAVGSDTHSVGIMILSHVLRAEGFEVVFLGVQNKPEEFIQAAIETAADAIWVSSLCGHAEIDCRGFRDKCYEAGLSKTLLYIGGNLMVGKVDWKQTEKIFLEMGFDRVYPPDTLPDQPVADLKQTFHNSDIFS